MTQPATDLCDVDEAQEALGSLVVAEGGTRAFLNLLKYRSTRLRRRYKAGSTPTRFLRDLRMGMTGKMSRLSMDPRMLSA